MRKYGDKVMVLITGGAGFIGANLVHCFVEKLGEQVINVDKMTYAGNLQNLASLFGNPLHVLVRADIADRDLLLHLLTKHAPRAVINLAAETHVDRSIRDPEVFVATNVTGTLRLLEAARAHWSALPEGPRAQFRFVHISTDEVYGSLDRDAPAFCETTRYAPNSPYSASKAASDHLVRSFHHTYGLPVITLNCSNNYGPYQFPEKLIPLAIHRALAGEAIPIYGDGGNIRDWLHVSDHCEAIRCALESGRPGETYNVGGGSEKTNLEVVGLICAILDREKPRSDRRSYAEQITFVRDRPGHDKRYAIDGSKITSELGWRPREDFASGLEKTVRWYLGNQEWVSNVASGAYRDWIALHYEERSGTA